jgi:hypothetical protein
MSDTSEQPRDSAAGSTDENIHDLEKEANTPPSKRRLVRTACLPCRKRKSKVPALSIKLTVVRWNTTQVYDLSGP